jgi:hypothetical protein
MIIDGTEIVFTDEMDKEEHTLTLNLWQWDHIMDALALVRKREEEQYRRYRELRKLQDWTNKKKVIDALRETEHFINCELRYQIEGKRCEKCQAETEKLIDQIIGKEYSTKDLLEGRHMIDEHYEQFDHNTRD